jgi:hypothetical protein
MFQNVRYDMRACVLVRPAPTNSESTVAGFVHFSEPQPTPRHRFGNVAALKARRHVAQHGC